MVRSGSSEAPGAAGEPVAVKRLHADIVEENPDIVDRFQREGEAACVFGGDEIAFRAEDGGDELADFLLARHYATMGRGSEFGGKE